MYYLIFNFKYVLNLTLKNMTNLYNDNKNLSWNKFLYQTIKSMFVIMDNAYAFLCNHISPIFKLNK
ncbi:hypothetical protein V1477_010100 [Vespula maculifrons]|uniref:Uncharacterized protein n=1 Tax=Vespula maculifrons TaxID=7453 RepID=A0ABD2CBN4_VESMC